MMKTQVYISNRDSDQILNLAKQFGRKKSEVVRDAIHEYCQRYNGAGYQSALKEVFGILRQTPMDSCEVRKASRKGFESE